MSTLKDNVSKILEDLIKNQDITITTDPDIVAKYIAKEVSKSLTFRHLFVYWLKRKFCAHKYTIIRTSNIHDGFCMMAETGTEIPIGVLYIMQCDFCGKLKRKAYGG